MMRVMAVMLMAAPIHLMAQDDFVPKDLIIEQLTGDARPRGILVEERPDPTGMSIGLRIGFEFDSAVLSQDAREQLDDLLEAFLDPALHDYRFQIVGHTDGQGDAQYNRNLSYERARSVMQYMVDRGVGPRRLVVVGKGEDELLLPHAPADALNRRVEIVNDGKINN